jgi:hypothetical protein
MQLREGSLCGAAEMAQGEESTFLAFFLSGLTRSASVLGPSSSATRASSARLTSAPSAHFSRARTPASSALVLPWYLPHACA